MKLADCAGQGYAYHVVNIIDLKRTLAEGIRFDDKTTYDSKYYDFHSYFDYYKPKAIPDWVERKKAIFASICFDQGHKWHSHSAILRIKILEGRCWVCNENLANFIYEPFILRHMEGFDNAREYIEANGKALVEEYWRNSLSYKDNLVKRNHKKEGYDAEILVMHPIPPEYIECLYIVSDHRIMTYKEWQDFFIQPQYSRFLHPESISSAWKTPGLQ